VFGGQESRRSPDFAAYSHRTLGTVEGSERDSTQDWLLPPDAAPPLVNELERRIDEALAIARASEVAVESVAASAFDAAERARRSAEQARRAAALAERASASLLEEREARARSTEPPAVERDETGLRGFTERADRVMARLRALERLPRRYPSPPAVHSRP
jgi:hypothetical protein